METETNVPKIEQIRGAGVLNIWLLPRISAHGANFKTKSREGRTPTCGRAIEACDVRARVQPDPRGRDARG